MTSRLIELLAAKKVGRGGQVSMQTAIRELKAIGASLEGIDSRAGAEPRDSEVHFDHAFADRTKGSRMARRMPECAVNSGR